VRRAALAWADLLTASPTLTLYQPPELDIVCYFPARHAMSAIDAASARMLIDGMTSGVAYLSTLRISSTALTRRHADIEADQNDARILRSVLMKPEHEAFVPELHARVERLAREQSHQLDR
jgi:hypothetical protein